MNDGDSISQGDMLTLTADIVGAHVSRNSVATADLPELIRSVFGSLSRLGSASAEPEAVEALKPAVPVRRSVTPDYIICLEDGRKLKMLKRHLRTAYNMSPDEYRQRWNLPADYPMVAPDYAERRRSLAKKIGLGRKPQAGKKRGRRSPTVTAQSPAES